MAQAFDRPASGFRFKFGGMRTNCAPDACPSDKYSLLQNARAYSDDEIRCRPGMESIFSTGTGQIVSNVASYSQGQGNIRYLAASNGKIFQDDSATAIDSSFSASAIQSMIPYRPNQSPGTWIYVGDPTSYKKFSFPNAGDVVTVAKVGIAEPQDQVYAASPGGFVSPVGLPLSGFSAAVAGTAGSLTTGARVSDNVVAAFTDPANAALEYTQVSASVQYQRGMIAVINAIPTEVLDVFQPCSTPIVIQGIYYFSGTTGRCIIVPGNVGQGPGNGQSVFDQAAIASLRRGSIVSLGPSNIVCLVLSVTVGPNGQVCFETNTSTHTILANQTMTILPSISAESTSLTGTITSSDYQFQVTSGIGTFTISGLAGSAFVNSENLFQDQDYLHFSVKIDNLANLTEMKILLDIGDGSFTQNFLFYAVRPSDIAAGVANTLTQLGVAQLYSQRQTIMEEDKASGAAASTQTPPGSSQWAEIFVPIGELIRVGNDQTRSLLTLDAIQLLFNASGTINVAANSIDFRGGYQVDVGLTGAPYRYRIRPRSTTTGVKGNPSPDMRYGISPRRDQVTVNVPATAYDTQFNTWDVFRLGGVLTAWTFAGTCPVGTTQFLDIYDDTTIQNSQQLEFDNLEPWPSIDVPLNGTCSVVGTTAVVTPAAGSSSLIANYLPGNKVQVNQQVFTLWNRPVSLGGGTWLFQFQENAGVYPAGSALSIYEPSVANQQSRMTFGPTDDGGVIFGLDALRPGTVSFTKNFNPDSVPDNYNLELSPPSEPLMGGAVVGNLVAVGSSNRKWTLRPSFGQANQWTPLLLPGGGLASPFGMCTDGVNVYAIEKTGITKNGESITTADLSNLFPQDGVQPPKVSYRGVFFPPDYTKANTFRLACDGTYVYFNFTDMSNVQRTLVYDIKRNAWSIDISSILPYCYVPVVQAQSQATGTAFGTNPVQLLIGDQAGTVYEQLDGVDDNGNAINFRVITAEYTGGEERAQKQWGDVFLSALPTLNSAMTINGTSGGVTLGTTINAQSNPQVRAPYILNAGNPILFSYGLDIIANVTYATGEVAPVLYIWQPALIPQPVVEQQRAQDWDDAGQFGNKFWQGLLLTANTNGINKSIGVRDADGFALHPFTPFPVNFPRQSEQAFSFPTPFLAHSVRLEPQDAVNWNCWGVKWIVTPYPDAAETWDTQGMTHGLKGFLHLRLVNLAYVSTAPVTLTVTTDTGFSIPLAFAATGLQLSPAKVISFPTFNKGKVYTYSVTSLVPFYLFKDMCECWVRSWGDSGPYQKVNMFGGPSSEMAQI
jgi:hypothetical protein